MASDGNRLTAFRPVEKQRVAEEISEQLRRMILSGEYPPGAKLPPERDLAKTLGVNRASLREALKKLEHLGLVQIRQGDGTRVRNFMESGGMELMAHLLPMAAAKPELLRDLLEFRRIFGRELAMLAAHRGKLPGSAELVAKLQRIIDAGAEAGNAAAVFELDFEFYVVLAQVTHNHVMLLLINSVREAVRPHTHLLANLAGNFERVRNHQSEIVTAILAGDPATAGRVADEYLRWGAQLAQAAMGRPEMAPLPGG